MHKPYIKDNIHITYMKYHLEKHLEAPDLNDDILNNRYNIPEMHIRDKRPYINDHTYKTMHKRPCMQPDIETQGQL